MLIRGLLTRWPWRCAEEIGGERCGYPGAISNGVYGEGPWYCSPHYRLKGTTAYSEMASLQIIERSRSFERPKTALELMEEGIAGVLVGSAGTLGHSVDGDERREHDSHIGIPSWSVGAATIQHDGCIRDRRPTDASALR